MSEDDQGSLSELTASVRALEAEVSSLAHRVRDLERHGAPGAHAEGMEELRGEPSPSIGPDIAQPPGRSLVALTGRSFLVLAGAFLLRAMTDTDVLDPALGVLAALVYGTLWLGLALRTSTRRGSIDATFHGVTSALITLPVIWEATTKLDVCTPAIAAVVLVVEAVLGTFVGARRRLPFLAWTFTLAPVFTAFALRIATGAEVVFIGAVLAVGLLTVWLAYGREWTWLRWPVAIAANLAVLELTFSTGHALSLPDTPTRPWPALAVTTALVAVYFGSFVVRTLARRRNVRTFEIAQSCAVLAIGILGSFFVLRSAGVSTVGLGAALVGSSVASYAVAFAFVRRRLGRGRNFFFYSALGITVGLVGLPLLLPAPFLPATLGVLAVVGAYIGGRHDRITLRSHAAVYAVFATVTAGVPGFVWQVFFGSGDATSTPTSAIVLTQCLLAYAILVATQQHREVSAPRRLPRFVVGALSLSGLAAHLVDWGTESIASGGPARAAVATAAISLLAIGVAAAGRRRAFRELSWLTYPLILAGAARILLKDLHIGTPTTLFLGFAFYGLALLVAPRLRRVH